MVALTPREREVAGLLVERRSNKEIARELGIRVRTVETHVLRIMGKLGAASRLDAGEEWRRLRS